MLNIFDTTFNGTPHSEMYRGWVDPVCFPGQPPARLENWDPEDVLDYCGPTALKEVAVATQ